VILLEMRFGKFAAALLLIAASATAQGLAAETELLARIGSHMREEFSHVTNYTCLESTARFHAEGGAQAKTQSKLAPLDFERIGGPEDSFGSGSRCGAGSSEKWPLVARYFVQRTVFSCKCIRLS
jgi:hypothetical protein